MKIQISLITVIAVLFTCNLFGGPYANDRYLKRGYVQNDRGEKCWYNQSTDEDSHYFHGDNLAGTRGIMTFENAACMSGKGGLGLEINMRMINIIISRWYSRSDAKFQTRTNQLYSGSTLQIRGKCIQSATYPIMGIAVDYEIEDDSITKVHHGSTVDGCKN